MPSTPDYQPAWLKRGRQTGAAPTNRATADLNLMPTILPSNGVGSGAVRRRLMGLILAST